jgi:hypothetical protein
VNKKEERGEIKGKWKEQVHNICKLEQKMQNVGMKSKHWLIKGRGQYQGSLSKI